MSTEIHPRPLSLARKLSLAVATCLLVAASIFIATSCSSQPQEPIVGKWEFLVMHLTSGNFDENDRVVDRDTASKDLVTLKISPDLTFTWDYSVMSGEGNVLAGKLEKYSDDGNYPSWEMIFNEGNPWLLTYAKDGVFSKYPEPTIVVTNPGTETFFLKAQ